MISVSVGCIHFGICPSRRFRSSRDCRCILRGCRSVHGRRSECLRFRPALRYAHIERPMRSETSQTNERLKRKRIPRDRPFRHLQVDGEHSDWSVPFRRCPLTPLVLLIDEQGAIGSIGQSVVRCLRCVSTSVSISSCSKLVTIGSSSSSSAPPVVSPVDAISLGIGLTRTDRSVGAINALPRRRCLSNAAHSISIVRYLRRCSTFRSRLLRWVRWATAVIHYFPWPSPPPTTFRYSPSESIPATEAMSLRMMRW